MPARRLLWFAASLAALLLAWAVIAGMAPSRLLPSPLRVWSLIVEEGLSGELFRHTAITLMRVAGSFVLAMGIGSGLGLGLGRRPLLNRFFDPWLVAADRNRRIAARLARRLRCSPRSNGQGPQRARTWAQR